MSYQDIVRLKYPNAEIRPVRGSENPSLIAVYNGHGVDAISAHGVNESDVWKSACDRIPNAPLTHRFYVVQVQVSYKDKDGWSSSAGLPTFLIDRYIQMLSDENGIRQVVLAIVNPLRVDNPLRVESITFSPADYTPETDPK